MTKHVSDLASARRRRTKRALPTWSVGRHVGAPRAPMPMCFTHEAHETLIMTVGTRPPETGAKLFGPKDVFGIDTVEFDRRGSARASGAAYAPDVAWGEGRMQYHLDKPDDRVRLWTGDAHSHPASLGTPSERSGPARGDLGYVTEVFARNDAMLWFACPIITQTSTGHVVVHPWVCRRGVARPFLADYVVCDIKEFPEREFDPAWLATLTEEKRGTSAKPRPRRRTPTQREPLARDPVLSGDTSAVGKRYYARLDGLISREFHSKRIVAVGVGGGSYAVEKLARLGPGHITIVDPDIVELSNIARTVFTTADVGLPKVHALARRIREVNPAVEITAFQADITNLTPRQLDDLLDGADGVMAGTDRFTAQAMLNEECVDRGIPAVFVGVHARADGGRIIWTIPGEAGCYRCLAAERYEAAASPAAASLDLAGARGAVVDLQFIDTVALKIVAAILERGQPSHYGRFYEAMRGRNDVIVRCHPEYAWGNEMWDAVLADLPHEPKPFATELRHEAFLAMDTLWLRGHRDPACPVCGGR